VTELEEKLKRYVLKKEGREILFLPIDVQKGDNVFD